jgi:hypothetical protein
VFPSVFTEFVTNNVRDVQSRDWQVRSDLLQNDMCRVVGANIKISACVRDHLHAFGEEFRYG